MIKVIGGHVAKELVTNPVNGMNELVPALLTVLLCEKVHKCYSRCLRILCVQRRLLLYNLNKKYIRDVKNSNKLS